LTLRFPVSRAGTQIICKRHWQSSSLFWFIHIFQKETSQRAYHRCILL